jgi:hypothetical protein
MQPLPLNLDGRVLQGAAQRLDWRTAAIPLAIGLAGILLAPQSAQAQPWDGKGSWCVEHRSYYDCAFYSYQQCMATASGVSNVCSRNPLYVPRGRAPRAQVRPRRSRE